MKNKLLSLRQMDLLRQAIKSVVIRLGYNSNIHEEAEELLGLLIEAIEERKEYFNGITK